MSVSGEVFADSITQDTDQILHVVFTNPWTIMLCELFNNAVNIPHELFTLGEQCKAIHSKEMMGVRCDKCHSSSRNSSISAVSMFTSS